MFILKLLFLSALSFASTDVEPVCVTKSEVDLHRAPEEKSPVSWIVGRYMPLLKTGEARDKQKRIWLEVRDADGERHWVRASRVSNKASCAVVKTKFAALREGPGPEFPASEPFQVDRYTTFKKVDREGSWIQVEDEGKIRYWIQESQLWIPLGKTRISFQ